jgi:alpha-beta hydrolase superfamily lysophospholipase
VNKIAFGSYNKGIKPLRTPADWISRDEVIVDQYVNEPRCQFLFTVNGFFELFKGIQFISSSKNIAKIPREMPILFISGEADPVGGYGEGVQKVHDMFTLAGNEQLDMLMYDGARHEVLNEINRKDVYEDLYAWLNKEISFKH